MLLVNNFVNMEWLCMLEIWA